MNKQLKLHGLVAAVHTPFHADGSLNPSIVDAQAKHLAAQDIKLAFITGSTGESSSMQLEERKEIYAAWKEAGSKYGVGVIAHTGGNSVQDAHELAGVAQEMGFLATSSLSPSYFKPGSVELLVECCAHAASGAPDLPYYFYDIPVLTGVRFNPITFMKLAKKRIPNFAGIKFTNPDLALYMDALNFENGAYDLPWGVDEWFAGALATGAKGAVGSSFNFAPALYLQLMKSFAEGDMETVRECQLRSVQMINIIASRGYMGVAKAVMGWQGVPVGIARLPQGNPSETDLKEVRSELEAIGFFKWALK
ncbi:MAG: dihydrodipicolinate synthase family protein [Akkermansia sp.]